MSSVVVAPRMTVVALGTILIVVVVVVVVVARRATVVIMAVVPRVIALGIPARLTMLQPTLFQQRACCSTMLLYFGRAAIAPRVWTIKPNSERRCSRGS